MLHKFIKNYIWASLFTFLPKEHFHLSQFIKCPHVWLFKVYPIIIFIVGTIKIKFENYNHELSNC